MTPEQLNKRHADLVDKKFETSLSKSEKEELVRIKKELEKLYAPIYQPVINKLKK